MELRSTRCRTIASAALSLAMTVQASLGAEQAAVARPTHSFPNQPRRIHIARGLYWRYLRLHRAIAEAGGMCIGVSHDHLWKKQATFPTTADKLYDCNAIILAGSSARGIAPETQELIRQWVNDGGGLLVTGGPCGLDGGTYHETILEELLPAFVEKELSLADLSPGGLIEPTTAAAEILGDHLPWNQKPRVIWAHDPIHLKDGVKVLLVADGKPLLVAWEVGKGRVMLLTATPCGIPAQGKLPFWDWSGWPLLMADVLGYLARTPEISEWSAPHDPEYEQKLQRLEELAEPNIDELLLGDEDPSMGAGRKEQAGEAFVEISKLMSTCRDRRFARAVARALTESQTQFNVDQAEKAFSCIGAWADEASFGKLGLRLAKSDNAGRAALGLRLLGRSQLTEGKTLAVGFLAEGLAALENPLPEVIQRSGAPDGEDERLRLSAVRAAAAYSDPGMLETFRSAADQWRRDKSSEPMLQHLNADLEDEVLSAMCLMGDGNAGAKLLEAMIANTEAIHRALDLLDTPVFGTDRRTGRERRLAAESVPLLRARNARIENVLTHMPDSALPVTAESIRDLRGTDIEIYLLPSLSAGEGRPSGATAEALLKIMVGCPVVAVKTVCARRLRDGHGERLAGVLAELACGNRLDGLFAVSQIVSLPPEQRVAIIRAALEHQDAAVRRASVRAVPLSGEQDRGTLMDEARKLAETDEEITAILKDLGS